MRSRTPKRAKQEIEYAKVCEEVDEEERALRGAIYCFFCNEKVGGTPSHHHLRGRGGVLLTDKRWLVCCHNDHHLDYHNLPVRKQKWREIFMENLREKDPQTYFKEREKENK
jgi:hypothetical protein